MKEYLKNVNDEKLKTVFEVRNAYDEGKLNGGSPCHSQREGAHFRTI